jgi:hypothetical protein
MKLNDQIVMTLTPSILTNKATTSCAPFTEKVTKQEISSDKIILSKNYANLSWEINGGAG